MALYVAMTVFFCSTHVVDVSALSICTVLSVCVVVISMCVLYASVLDVLDILVTSCVGV